MVPTERVSESLEIVTKFQQLTLCRIPILGRTSIYIVTFFIFVILLIPTALVQNIGGLLVLRFLLGWFGELFTYAAIYCIKARLIREQALHAWQPVLPVSQTCSLSLSSLTV
jgi:hypothetical protein